MRRTNPPSTFLRTNTKPSGRRRGALLAERNIELPTPPPQPRSLRAVLLAGLPPQTRAGRPRFPAGLLGPSTRRQPRPQALDLLLPDLLVELGRVSAAPCRRSAVPRTLPEAHADPSGSSARDQDVPLTLALAQKMAEQPVELLLGGRFIAPPTASSAIGMIVGSRSGHPLRPADLVAAAIDLDQLAHLETLHRSRHSASVAPPRVSPAREHPQAARPRRRSDSSSCS